MGVVKLNLSDYIHCESQPIKRTLDRCADPTAYILFRIRAIKQETEQNDDYLSNIRSADMNSIDSNPRSDMDFEDFNTDLKETEAPVPLTLPPKI